MYDFGFAPNPAYGSGLARRRVRMTGRPGQVLVEMEDGGHGMRCLLHHDGARITAVEPEFIRVPMVSCAGAVGPIQEVVGMPVGADYDTFFADGRVHGNCTHMFDLAWLGAAHAARGETVRVYDAQVEDDDPARPAAAVIARDGATVLEWGVRENTVLGPERFAGRDLLRGFVRWLRTELADDELEAALILHKTCFVAQQRRIVMPTGPVPQPEQAGMRGACYGYSAGEADRAIRLGDTFRDFTSNPEDLLHYR